MPINEPMFPFFLLLFLFFVFPSSLSEARFSNRAEPTTILINCGSFSSITNDTWLSDRYFSSGAPAVVSEPHAFSERQHRTLRFFPTLTSGLRNCYSIPRSDVFLRYHLRLFAVYDNYDSKLRPPSFDVSLGPTLLLSYRSPWRPSPNAARLGAFSDLFAFSDDGGINVCFRSVDGDAPVVGTIEVFGLDPLAYNVGSGVVLVNYGRVSCGSDALLAGDDDRFGRLWQPEGDFLSQKCKSRSSSISTNRQILGTDLPPNHFPSLLYKTATLAAIFLEYLLDADVGLDYILWLHFSEIDPAIIAHGQRVFDVTIDGQNATRIDVYKEVGAFAAFKWKHVVRNVTRTKLVIRLVGVIGDPMICGIESYAMVPVEEETVRNQVEAMVALKESLGVPERMGWNGDPCAPATWEAWEGVTCGIVEGSKHVITHLDLSGNGLRGYISNMISHLSNLVSLNMSHNYLKGTLPPDIKQASLRHLDLSGNKLSGSIPQSFGSSNMQLVLLNDNELEGLVPGKLYSIGVRGGVIDLSGNKDLCGVPSLPPCPFFWQKTSLSGRGKIAIGLTSMAIIFFVILLSYILCKRRGRNGYSFAYSDDLASVRRSRYQRQKSLMQIEMESQHAKGLPSTTTPFRS